MSKNKQIVGGCFKLDFSKMVMKTFINVSIIICCSILIISCGSDLSRSKAERLIDSSPQFSKVKSRMPLNTGGFAKGIRQDKWDNEGHVTSSGQSDFTRIESKFIELAKPLNVVLEITGITDAPLMQGVKEVHFSWKYQNIPSTIKRFIVEGGTGQAYIRKYDDGWRVDDTTIHFSEVAVKQEPKEIAQEQKEEAIKEEERRVQAEKERREAERIQTVLQKSKTKTRTIGQFEFSNPTMLGTAYNTVIVSDVDIVKNSVERFKMGGQNSKSESLWLRQIDNVQVIQDINNSKCQNRVLLKGKNSTGSEWGSTLVCSSDKSKIDELAAVISRTLVDWRANNSEVVQKNLY